MRGNAVEARRRAPRKKNQRIIGYIVGREARGQRRAEKKQKKLTSTPLHEMLVGQAATSSPRAHRVVEAAPRIAAHSASTIVGRNQDGAATDASEERRHDKKRDGRKLKVGT